MLLLKSLKLTVIWFGFARYRDLSVNMRNFWRNRAQPETFRRALNFLWSSNLNIAFRPGALLVRFAKVSELVAVFVAVGDGDGGDAEQIRHADCGFHF